MPVLDIIYRAEPTIAKFHKSNAFVRGLMGPVGCVAAETEYLSPTGWKRIDEYDGGKVAQWSKQTAAIEWVVPDNYVVLDCKELWQFSCPGRLSMALSDEHRVPMYSPSGRFCVRSANTLVKNPSNYTIPVNFKVFGEGVGYPAGMVRVIVAIHARGSFNDKKNPRFCQIILTDEREKRRVRAIMDAIGFVYKEKVVSDETTFMFVSPYTGTHFGPEWWQATTEQLAAVAQEINFWYDSRFTASKEEVDFIQYAAHAGGYRARIINKRGVYKVRIRKAATVSIDNSETVRIPAPGGKKYCFSVKTGFFIARHNNYIFVTGNSGKSVGCWMEIINKATAQEPWKDGVRRTRWAVIRNTFPELKTTTIKTAMDWMPEPIMAMNWGGPIIGTIRFQLSDGTVVDAEILFLALDTPKDVKKLLSLELTGAWLNEARELPYEVVEGVSMRLGRYPAKRYGGPSWVGMFMDTNPPDDDHWWFKYAELERPKDWDFFRQPSALLRYDDGKGGIIYINNQHAENVQNQPLGYRYWHNMLSGKSIDWLNVYVMGNYGTIEDGKAVYPEYNDSIHCAKEDIETLQNLPLRLGWDFGLTPAVAIFQITPGGRCLVLDEIVATDMGVRRFIRDVVKPHLSNNYQGMNIISVGDPAGKQRSQTQEDTCMQILAEEGLRTTPAYTQELIARREAVSMFLTAIDVDGKPNFLLSPKCRYLRKGFNGAYKYKRIQVASDERYQDKPDKTIHSHVHEALQYGLLEVVRGYRVKKPTARARSAKPRSALGWT